MHLPLQTPARVIEKPIAVTIREPRGLNNLKSDARVGLLGIKRKAGDSEWWATEQFMEPPLSNVYCDRVVS